MDPRHPELAISRMRELMKQYDRVEKDMGKATTSAQLAQLEREGGLVVQEICLVAPRIHEAMMQTSRQRRHDLARGVVIDMSKYKVPEGTHGDEVGVVEKLVEGPKLTPEEEEDFARLLVILDNAKKQFGGKDAKNKETGEIYTNLYFLTIKPFSTDNIRYGIVVSMRNDKEIISFENEKVIDFLNDYEPVEDPVEELVRNKADVIGEENIGGESIPVKKPATKKTTRKKKTTKKAE